jgi:hypothetical protein
MASYHEILTLSDSEATELTPEGKIHSGLDLTIQNLSETANIYIGTESVTTTDYGYKLTPGAGFSIELNPRDELYAVSDVDETQAALLRVLLEDIR